MLWTIAKNEFRLMWVTPIGYVATASFVFIYGVLFAGQLLSPHRVPEADIGALAATLPVVLVLLIPILTMRSLAEERRAGTELLHRSLPVPPWRVVLGKFLAVALTYAVMLAASGIYPLFTHLLGGSVDAKALGGYAALLGLGFAYIAVGIAFSAATASQFVAAIGTFLALFFLQGLGRSFAAVAGGGVAAAVRALGLDALPAERIEALRVATAGILVWLNPATRLGLFHKGIVPLVALVYFASFALVFLGVAWLLEERRRRAGARRALGFAVAAVIIVTGNGWLTVSRDRDWRWDATREGVFTLGEASRRILAELDEPLLIWGLFDREGAEENDTVLFVDQYRRHGRGAIEVRYANPERDRGMLVRAGLPGDLDLAGVHYIVLNRTSGRYRLIRAADIFASRRDHGGEALPLLSVEQAFSGAIHGLGVAAVPVAFTRGHGEEKLRPQARALTAILEEAGCQPETLDLALGRDIPADTRLLVMLGPDADIGAAAARRIADYLEGGGSLLLLLGYGPAALPNLAALAAGFGVDITANRLRETHPELCLAGDPLSFVTVSPDGDVVAGTQSLLAIRPREIRATEPVPARVRLTNLAQTSNGVTAQPGADAARESRPGIRTVGVAGDILAARPGRLAVLGSAEAFTDTVMTGLGSYSGAHRRFIAALAAWLLRREDGGLAIHAKGIPNYHVALTSGTLPLARAAAYCGILVVPALLLAAAAAVQWRRRRG